MNEVSLFNTQLPAHVTGGKNSKTMQAMAGGLAGGGFGNRISLRNSKFRFIQNGSDIGASPDPTLDVVIFAMATHVQRMYYAGAFDPNSKDPPTCFSHDGKTPSDESAQKQSPVCATCPQNVKGSGRMPNTKACAYKKRVVVLSAYDLDSDMYALDVSGMSMFGEQDESKHLYSFKGYYEKLVAHDMDIAAIVTRLSFDDKASVPKLHFTPVRALTAEEFAVVQQRMEDPEVERVLADMTNEEEVQGANAAPPVQQRVTQQAVPQPQPAPVVGSSQDRNTWGAKEQKGVGGLIQDVAPPARRGFPSKQTTASVQQEPVKANGGASAPEKLNIDLSKLVTFD